MTKRLSETQRNVLNKIGAFGLEGGSLPSGKHATQIMILATMKLIEPRAVGKWAVTLTGCEFVGINYTNAIDAAHEIALILNAPASEPIPAKMPLAPLMDAPSEVMDADTAPETVEQTFKDGDKVTNKNHPELGIATISWKLGRLAGIRYESGVTENIKTDNLALYVDPRDAEIAQLKARLAMIDEAAELVAEAASMPIPGERQERLWAIRLEQLYATVQTSKGETPLAAPTPMEELQAWAKGKRTYIIEILSPSEGESYILEGMYRSREAAALEGMTIRNESYRGWSVFVTEKYPNVNQENASHE